MAEFDDRMYAELKAGIDQRFDALEKSVDQQFTAHQRAVDAALIAAKEAVEAAMTAAKEAVLKAEAATDKRFEAMNEIRSAMSDQQRLYLPRQEYDTSHLALAEKITVLTDRMNKSEGNLSGSIMTRGAFFATLAGVGVMVGIIVALFKLWKPI